MRQYLNDNFLFKEDFNDNYFCDQSSFKKIRIPHTVKELNYNYINIEDYSKISTYFTNLTLLNYEHIFLCFEGVAHVSEVYVNNKLVKTHNCGYTSFKIDLTDYRNSNINLLVKVNSKEDNNVPPFGNVIDYLTYGGIYRDVYLEYKNDNYIEDIKVETNKEKELKLNLKFYKKNSNKLHIKISDLDVVLPLNDEYKFKLDNVNLWDTINPNLYELKLELLDDDKIIDELIYNIGFRSFELKNDKFYLNDKNIKIFGLNRHQSYPIVGYAMPKSMQEEDAKILKYELGLNSVRTSHYPQSHDFINACDKLGLLVFMEIPGWQYIGDKTWKQQALINIKDMINEFYNHPSIYMWGVRINESSDDTEFYKQTNEIARNLDKTRLIGGVRCIKNSEFFEDVYTYNDFSFDGSNDGILNRKKVTKSKKGYLISEYNGHMYPTKMYDDELHRTSHLKRHLKVLDYVNKYDDVMGSYGWCFADYNTHKDFGSGDNICYHGVLDMYRNKKLASFAYSSQSDNEIILELNSSMNIGEYPGGYLKEILCITNCDFIKVYKNDEFVGDFYPSKDYKYLKHPPIIIDDLVGDLIYKHESYSLKTSRQIKKCLYRIKDEGLENMSLKTKLKMLYLMIFKKLTIEEGTRLYGKYIGGWGDKNTTYKILGFKDNKEVKELKIESFEKLKFDFKVSSLTLIEDKSYDVSLIRIEALNQVNNHLNYFNDAIKVKTSGNIELIGNEELSFNGGFCGLYIKSNGIGEGNLKIYYKNELIKEFNFVIKGGINNE